MLLFVTLFFLGIYNFAFKKNDSKIVEQGAEIQQVATPVVQKKAPIKVEKIKPVSEQGVIGAVFDKKNDSILYYSANDGTTWKSDSDGKARQQLSTTKVMGLKNVLWSPDRSKVLTTVNVDSKDVFYQYDNIAQKAVALKDGLDTAVWDNLGSKIFYKYYDQLAKARTLNIANPDGSGWQKLADVEARDLSIAQIPLTSVVSYWNYPRANEETKFQKVGISGGEPQLIFSGKFGADYLWSPDGSLALISSLVEKDSKKITLGIINSKGEYTDLNVPTIVSKCVWSSDNKTVYYALAGSVPETAIMPNDYQDNKFNTKDTFWKLDITTGKKDRLVEPAEIVGVYDSKNLFLSAAEDTLYFVNKMDKKLYRIEL